MLEGLDLAIGVVTGEQAIEGHASGVEVLLAIRGGAGEGFRGDVAGCAGQGVRLVARQAGAVGQAEVEQAQLAVVAPEQVLRLDVAVQDIAPVQQAQGPEQARRQVQPFRQAQRAGQAQVFGQGLPGVFALHVVEVLALRQRMGLGEVAAGHAAQEPFLQQQGRTSQGLVVAAGRQSLEQPAPGLGVAHPVHQRLARLGQQALDLPALEVLALAQLGRQRPLLQLGQGVGQVVVRQRVDLHQHGAGVVLAAGQVSSGDQRLAGGGRVVLVPQQAADAGVAQGRPDAVADQQVALALAQLAFQVVHHQVLVQAQGALEHMLHAWLFPHMVLAEALQLAAVQAVGAAVADMRQGEAATAQDQGGEGGEQRLAAAAGLQPAVVRQQ